jgi:hypothetical protein
VEGPCPLAQEAANRAQARSSPANSQPQLKISRILRKLRRPLEGSGLPGSQDEKGSLIVVSNDTDLLSMSPWRGTPIIDPQGSAAKVDAMRRHARRRRR